MLLKCLYFVSSMTMYKVQMMLLVYLAIYPGKKYIKTFFFTHFLKICYLFTLKPASSASSSWIEITDTCATNVPACWTDFNFNQYSLQLKIDWTEIAKSQQFWHIRVYKDGKYTGLFRRNPDPNIFKFFNKINADCATATEHETKYDPSDDVKRVLVWTILKNSTHLKIFIEQDLYFNHELVGCSQSFLVGTDAPDQVSFLNLEGSLYREGSIKRK